MKKLEGILKNIDGKGYKSYKDIRGKYDFKDYILDIIYVQGDPFASPSLFNIVIALDKYGYEKELYSNESRKVAFEDYVSRVFAKALRKESKGKRGTGKRRATHADAHDARHDGPRYDGANAYDR